MNNSEHETKLLTNFKLEELGLYNKAIVEYGKDRLFVSPYAYDKLDRLMVGYCALYTTSDSDLTEFWEIFKNIENTSNE
jgi:hypothetical protein